MSHRTAWDRICIARSQNRPKSRDILPKLFDEITELYGDRCYGDDAALIGAIGRFEGMPVTILAQSKGRDLQENLACNFGMMNPEGYRKAMRLAKQAEKFHRPIITIIDTAGAFPGKGAEERGQAEAIASSLKMFATLQTPVIAIVLSEGGSGGALALSVADRIYMMENAVYSILSCEGFASILWKDETRAKEAAELMECTAMDLAKKGIIDGIIMEPEGGFDHQSDEVYGQIRSIIRRELNILTKIRVKNLVQQRYEKFRAMGNV